MRKAKDKSGRMSAQETLDCGSSTSRAAMRGFVTAWS